MSLNQQTTEFMRRRGVSVSLQYGLARSSRYGGTSYDGFEPPRLVRMIVMGTWEKRHEAIGRFAAFEIVYNNISKIRSGLG